METVNSPVNECQSVKVPRGTVLRGTFYALIYMERLEDLECFAPLAAGPKRNSFATYVEMGRIKRENLHMIWLDMIPTIMPPMTSVG